MRSICPECGSPGQCYCHNVGYQEFQDEYTFVCGNCDHIERKVVFGGSAELLIAWITDCPFCGRPSNEHKKTPRGLRFLNRHPAYQVPRR